MSRIARLWKGAGLLTLGGVLLSGVVARGDDGPPLATQLNDLGRQALAQGASSVAQTFFQKALQLDPGNAEATRGLKDSKAATGPRDAGGLPGCRASPAAGGRPPRLRRPPLRPVQHLAAAQPPEPRATLEESEQAENIARQQLTNDVEQRLQAARNQVAAGQPEAALGTLRTGPVRRSLRDQRPRKRSHGRWTRESRPKCCSPSATRSGS